MMDLNAAADQIRQMAQRYEAMVLAADVLSKAGNLDNAVKEATARAKAANEAADKADAELKALHQSVADAKRAVETEYAEQRAKQEQVVADLTAEGVRLVQFAKDAAAQERAQVQAEADAIRADLAAASAKHTEAVKKARAQLKAAEEDTAAKAQELADIEARLAAAREAMGKLLAA